MIHALIPFLSSLASDIIGLFSGIDDSVLEIVKIFAVSIGWIGGLTLFMWLRDKRKLAHTAA